MPKAPTRDIITYYEETGSGEPLLMIMGLSGDLQAWALNVPMLSKRFRVITFDNRGAGRTSSPDKPYSIAQMAEDAAALLDSLGIAKAHVLGFSMGGYIAQELALAHPEKVEKLILLATAPSIDGYGRTMVEDLLTIRRTNISREGFVRHMAALTYSPEFLDDRERFERAVTNTANNPYPQQDHAFIRQCEAVLEFDASARLGDIKSPVLVVAGKDDVLVPPRNSEKLAKGLPNAQLKVLSGGHVGVIEYPHEYNEAFLEFLGTH